MQLEIVRGSAVPPYRQLAEQIGDAIRSGELAPGDRIPTRKELTEVYLLDLAPNTVQKAMDLLKEEGLVFTSPGLGLFVKDTETGETPAVDDVAAVREAIWADPARKASYAEAFRSFLIGTASERELYEEAVKRMTPDEATAYRASYHDRRRTSMSDICSTLWERADEIANYERAA